MARISVNEANGQITELVRRAAEAGEEILLTRSGHDVARIVTVAPRPGRAERRAVMERVRLRGAARAQPGPSAARSQDFLYDEDGLPK